MGGVGGGTTGASIGITPRALAMAAGTACVLTLALGLGSWVGFVTAGVGLAGAGLIARRAARWRFLRLSLPS